MWPDRSKIDCTNSGELQICFVDSSTRKALEVSSPDQAHRPSDWAVHIGPGSLRAMRLDMPGTLASTDPGLAARSTLPGLPALTATLDLAAAQACHVVTVHTNM